MKICFSGWEYISVSGFSIYETVHEVYIPFESIHIASGEQVCLCVPKSRLALEECAGRHPGDLLEHPIEMAGGAESGFVGDLLDGLSPVDIQLDGACHPLLVQVLVEAYARVMEQAAQVSYGESEQGSGFFDGGIVVQVLSQVAQDGLEAFVVGDGLRLEGDFAARIHRGEQFEEGIRELVQVGLFLPADNGMARRDETQVLGYHRIGVVDGKLVGKALLVSLLQGDVEDDEHHLPVVAAQFVFGVGRNPGYVFFRHEIVGRADLYPQCPRECVDNLVLPRMAVLFDIDFLPSGFVDDDFLFRRLSGVWLVVMYCLVHLLLG